MANFESAVMFVLRNEDAELKGAITRDGGGLTRFGIAQRYNPGEQLLYTLPMPAALDRAKELYRRSYWSHWFEGIVDQAVADRAFDCYINPGPGAGTKIVQQACCDCGQICAIDGGWGPQTVAAVNVCDPEDFIQSLRERREQYYQDDAERNPSIRPCLAGLVARARR